MLNHSFSSLSHHFSDYEETHLLIWKEGNVVPDLSYLAEQKAQKVALDARELSEENLPLVLEQLMELESLRSLVLVWNGGAFPKELTNFHNLQHLAICNKELASLPRKLGRLDRLRSLYLETVHLVGLPGRIYGLKNLRELFLDTHYMERLPGVFARLVSLEAFALRISDAYIHVDWGKTVYYHSKWTQPADEVFGLLAQLPRLKRLSLIEDDSTNHHYMEGYDYRIPVFKEIPESLENLRGLEELELWHNKGIDFPQSLGRLKRLRKLWAGSGQQDEVNRQFPVGRWDDEESPRFFEIGEVD